MAGRNGLCIVAAAGPGMGLAIAKRFAREGFAIAMLARDQKSLASLQNHIAASGGQAKGYAADLCDLTTVKAAFSEIRRDFGPANVLVYNGGSWHETPAMQIAPATFNLDLMLCVTGALVCAQAVYGDMKAARQGTILFTGGGLALYPQYGAGVSSLAAGKAGLRAFTYALAKELLPDEIHVGTVTIAGTVQSASAFDPDRIAEAYWNLHVQPRTEWSVETVFDGKPADGGTIDFEMPLRTDDL